MKKTAVIIIIFSLAATVAGCAHKGAPYSGRASGKALVAALGQGLLGGSFETLSAPERRQALQAEYKALEYLKAGDVASWGVEGQGASGNVVPGQPYQVGSLNCRQYSHSFTIGGVPQTVRGSACRNLDGSWSPL